MAERCGVETNNGSACRMAPVLGFSKCWNHEPSLAERRKSASQLGGIRRRRPKSDKSVALNGEQLSLRSADAILELLEATAADTLKLENGVQRSRTIAQLAQTAVRVLELNQLDERLARLEGMFEVSAQGSGEKSVLVC